MTDSSTYFIGIALEPELNEKITAFKLQLHNEITHSLKPLLPHITLLHPSSLRDVSLEEILPSIRRIATPFLPLTFSLGPIEYFSQNVLYIRINSPGLETLQYRLAELLPLAAQEAYHRRGYIPHVTLAQVRAPQALDCTGLYRRTNQEFNFPLPAKADSISYFTKVGPRDYHPAVI